MHAKVKHLFLIIAATSLCYLPGTAKLSFLLSDDYAFLHIMTSSPELFFTKLCYIAGFFRPIFNLYWSINFHLYGLNPFGYHLSILAIHIMNALLIFYILSTLTGHNVLAMLTSLIFSLHPVHNEAILLLTAGAGVLATLFFLLSLLTYLYWLKDRTKLCYIGSIAFFSLSLMSYESMFISALPILLVSSFLKGGKQESSEGKGWSQILLHLFPFMMMINAIFLVRYSIMGSLTSYQTSYTSNFLKFSSQNGWYMLKQLLLLAPSAHASPDAESVLKLTASSLTSLRVMSASSFLSIIVTLALRERIKPAVIKMLSLAITWVLAGALPFIIYGWGALPGRYSYFCSAGWSLLMALLFLACAKRLKTLSFIPIFFVFLIFYGANSTEIMYWEEAGQICKLVLTRLRGKLPAPPPGSEIFILNVPLAIDRAFLAVDRTSSWTIGAMVSYMHMKNSVGFSQWKENFLDRYGEQDIAGAIISYFIERLSPPSHSLNFFLSYREQIRRYIEKRGKEGEEKVFRWAYRLLANPELTLVLDYNMLRKRMGEVIRRKELAKKTYVFRFDGKDLEPIDYVITLTEWGKFSAIPIGSSANTSKPLIMDDLDRLTERLKSLHADWLRVDRDFLIIKKLPKIDHPFSTNFNGEIVLLGIDCSLDENAYTKNLSITYYWKKMAELKDSYTVFVHFLDSRGRIAFQQDHPLGGNSSNRWNLGEIMVESYRIELPNNIRRGRYSIRIGLWIPEKKKVIPVLKEGRAEKDIVGVLATFLEL